MREIEALAITALRSPTMNSSNAALATAAMPMAASPLKMKNTTSSPHPSNRNSATSLDSGRGSSAYANSSDGGAKLVSEYLEKNPRDP